MKRLFSFLSMAVAAMTIIGCQEKEIETYEPIPNEGSTFELFADIVQTKTTLDGNTYEVDWDEGDVIYMATSGEDTPWSAVPFTYSEGMFTNSSDPKATLDDGNHSVNAIYCAYDQATYHKNTGTTHKLQPIQNQKGETTIHIQDNDALAGSFDVTIPTDEPASVEMSHLYTLMQVNVKNSTGADIEITKFEMTAEANLAGIFTVSFATPAVEYKSGGSETISVNISEGTVSNDGSFPVYFVMAPLTNYSGDVTFRVTDSEGNTYTKTVTLSEKTFAAGTYNRTGYTISEVDAPEIMTLPYNETFESSLGSFKVEGTLPEGLSYLWSHDSNYSCAKATAYVSGTRYEVGDYYLVSPVIDLTKDEVAKTSFEHAGSYFNGTEQNSANVYVREVDGDWEPLSIPTYFTGWTFVNSGDIDLTAYTGKYIEIGFKYSSTSDVAGTWEIKNFSVTAEEAASEIKDVVDPETVSSEGAFVSVSYSIVNPRDGQQIKASTEADWIDSFDCSEEGLVKFTVEANESADPRSAVITLSYEGAQDINVTVKQEAKVEEGATVVTIVAKDLGLANAADAGTINDGLLVFGAGTHTTQITPKYYSSGEAIRMYKGNVLTVTAPAGSVLTSIVFTFVSGYETLTTETSTYENGTWTGEATCVAFNVPESVSQTRITKAVITYKEIEGYVPPTLKSIIVENPKTTYYIDDSFVEPIVKGTYSDGSSKEISGAEFSGYNMSVAGEYLVEVTYESFTTTYSITVEEASGDVYSKYSDELVEGYYIITYDSGAMKASVTSSRLDYMEDVISGETVNNPDPSIVWYLTKSGDYWTIYNESTGTYAAGTGAKNKAQLLEDGTDDKSLWSVSGTETFDFVNKANDAAGVNKTLRRNGTYGFACYAAGTGGALTLYKKK